MPPLIRDHGHSPSFARLPSGTDCLVNACRARRFEIRRSAAWIEAGARHSRFTLQRPAGADHA